MRKQVIVVGLAVVAALVGGGYYALLKDHVAESPSAADIRNPPAPTAEPQPAGTIERKPATRIGAALPPTSPDALAAAAADMLPGAPAPADRAAKIAELQQQGTPEANMRVFQLLQLCQSLRDVMTKRATTRADDPLQVEFAQFEAENRNACAGIDESLMPRRTAFLEQAAEGGYPGAALAMVDVGPNGDPTATKQRARDPDVIEWKERLVRLLEAAARRGDIGAIGLLAEFYRPGNEAAPELRYVAADPAKALKYRAAVDAIRRAQGKAGGTDAEREQWQQAFGSGLTPEQRTVATDDGRRFAEACCLKR